MRRRLLLVRFYAFECRTPRSFLPGETLRDEIRVFELRRIDEHCRIQCRTYPGGGSRAEMARQLVEAYDRFVGERS